jgi:hypothetical protein
MGLSPNIRITRESGEFIPRVDGSLWEKAKGGSQTWYRIEVADEVLGETLRAYEQIDPMMRDFANTWTLCTLLYKGSYNSKRRIL